MQIICLREAQLFHRLRLKAVSQRVCTEIVLHNISLTIPGISFSELLLKTPIGINLIKAIL